MRKGPQVFPRREEKKNLRVLPECLLFSPFVFLPTSGFLSLCSLPRARILLVGEALESSVDKNNRPSDAPSLLSSSGRGISQAVLRLAATTSALPPSLLPSRLLPSTESRDSEANRSHNSRKCSRRAGGEGTVWVRPWAARPSPPAAVAQVRTCIRWVPPRSQTKLVYRFHLACRRRRPLLTLTSAALCLVNVVSGTGFLGPSSMTSSCQNRPWLVDTGWQLIVSGSSFYTPCQGPQSAMSRVQPSSRRGSLVIIRRLKGD